MCHWDTKINRYSYPHMFVIFMCNASSVEANVTKRKSWLLQSSLLFHADEECNSSVLFADTYIAFTVRHTSLSGHYHWGTYASRAFLFCLLCSYANSSLNMYKVNLNIILKIWATFFFVENFCIKAQIMDVSFRSIACPGSCLLLNCI